MLRGTCHASALVLALDGLTWFHLAVSPGGEDLAHDPVCSLDGDEVQQMLFARGIGGLFFLSRRGHCCSVSVNFFLVVFR